MLIQITSVPKMSHRNVFPQKYLKYGSTRETKCKYVFMGQRKVSGTPDVSLLTKMRINDGYFEAIGHFFNKKISVLCKFCKFVFKKSHNFLRQKVQNSTEIQIYFNGSFSVTSNDDRVETQKTRKLVSVIQQGEFARS